MRRPSSVNSLARADASFVGPMGRSTHRCHQADRPCPHRLRRLSPTRVRPSRSCRPCSGYLNAGRVAWSVNLGRLNVSPRRHQAKKRPGCGPGFDGSPSTTRGGVGVAPPVNSAATGNGITPRRSAACGGLRGFGCLSGAGRNALPGSAPTSGGCVRYGRTWCGLWTFSSTPPSTAERSRC